MGTIIVKRPPRRPAPELPAGEVFIDPPPAVPEPDSKNWIRVLMILPMLAGTVAMGLLIGSEQSGPLAYVAGGMYGISVLGMIAMSVAMQAGGKSKREMHAARRQFIRHLSRLRAQVRATIRQQRVAMLYRHPEPSALWSTVDSVRLWERRPGDWDFGVLRIGVGPQAIATRLVPPQTKPVDELEPLCTVALRRFIRTYAVVPELPVALALSGFSHVYLRGPDDLTRGLVRAMLAQYAAFHAPDDVLAALCVSEARRAEWEWAKWLPHALHPVKTDAIGQIRLVASTVVSLEAMLDDVLAGRPRFGQTMAGVNAQHVVVVIDGGDQSGSDHLMTEGGVMGATIIHLSDPPPRVLDETTLVLDIAEDGTMSSTVMDGKDTIGRPDTLTAEEMEGLALQLAPLRLSTSAHADRPLTGDLGLSELLNLGDPFELDVSHAWTTRPNRDRLRIPFGVGVDGQPVELDLKESAQDGMGPHGLLIGATGSGKSELLRTLVLALAATHNPEILNFVLVDFKGGATFTKLDRLPHTSAVITNLSDDLSLIDRMLDALQGELMRRQELLRDAGNYASQRDYERARAAGAPLAPLPSLLIICDEFSELLSAKPDFIDMFVQIGRLGRSLGVHLMLASQRLEEGRLRGLDTHLSYRIGLRTFSAMESRVVLGAADAYELPSSPGHGYLKIGTERMTRFKAAYVSGTHRREGSAWDTEDYTGDQVRPYTTYYLAPQTDKDEAAMPPAVEDHDLLGETLLDVLVARLENRGVPARQVWLPPLAEPPTLDELLSPLTHDPERGLTTGDSNLHGRLRAVLGVIDKPFEQKRDQFWVDVAGSAGHLVVAGGPQSGKSTLLRTLIGSLALCHTPRETQFYCLDFGGGSMNAMRELPHVGGVAGRRDTDQVRRTVAEVYTLLQDREQAFAANGIENMATYRRLRLSDPRYAEERFGDVFLVIDGWLTLRNEFEDMEPLVGEIAARGLSFGIHLAVSCGRWMELRAAARDMFGTQLELRLGDPTDSMINRRTALNVPRRAPGRGLTPDALHMLTGLPRIDGQQDASDLADGVAQFVKVAREDWPGAPAPAVRLLPGELPYQELVTASTDEQRVPIGIAEADLQPVYLDFTAEPHFLLFGDVEAGKSGFLRLLARGITERYPPDQARIMLVDHRRSLLGSVSHDHLLGYGSSSDVTEDLVSQVVVAMRSRLPRPDVTAEQLRNRSWWTGPELYVLIDDYDLAATGAANPLLPLVEFMAQGRDIGLHIVVTRRVGGASRALFDPFLARIRDLASPGLLMSGPRDEGPLLGNVKPQLLPPGRGWLITRRKGAQLIQLAWLPPEG